MSACKQVKFRLRLVRFRNYCLAGFFEFVRGNWWVVLIRELGVSGCRSCRHHHNGRVTFLVRAESTRKGGEMLIFLTDEDRKRRKRLLKVMTKLKGPRHQVTLSQIPPSQKETWGAKSNTHFQARPRANSLSVAYEPAGDLC